MPPFVLLRFAKTMCEDLLRVQSHGAFFAFPPFASPFAFPPFLLPLWFVYWFLLMWCIKSHIVDISVLCLLLYLRFKHRSHWNIPSELKYGSSSPTLVQSTGKIQFHSTQKIFGNSHRNIWSNGKRPRGRFNFFLMWLRSCRHVAIMSLSKVVHTAASFLRR